MIRFNCNDSLFNSDLLPPTGGFNFTLKVPFYYLNNFKYQYSIFCLIYQNIIYAFVKIGLCKGKYKYEDLSRYVKADRTLMKISTY